ncbi:MAG: hypothetical protein ACRC80_26625 [Waterburya sp.]
MTPKKLKDHIVYCIGDDMGSYTYKNGVTEKAIAVGNIPNDVKVTGIEVILPIFPNYSKSNQYGDTYHHREEKWEVHLILHSQDKGLFYSTIDKLLRYFSRSYGVFLPPNSITRSLPQYTLTIIHSDAYRKIN